MDCSECYNYIWSSRCDLQCACRASLIRWLSYQNCMKTWSTRLANPRTLETDCFLFQGDLLTSRPPDTDMHMGFVHTQARIGEKCLHSAHNEIYTHYKWHSLRSTRGLSLGHISVRQVLSRKYTAVRHALLCSNRCTFTVKMVFGQP